MVHSGEGEEGYREDTEASLFNMHKINNAFEKEKKMHLLQFIRAPLTGIHCHLALVVAGRLLSSSAVPYETRRFPVTATSSYLHFAGTQQLH